MRRRTRSVRREGCEAKYPPPTASRSDALAGVRSRAQAPAPRRAARIQLRWAAKAPGYRLRRLRSSRPRCDCPECGLSQRKERKGFDAKDAKGDFAFEPLALRVLRGACDEPQAARLTPLGTKPPLPAPHTPFLHASLFPPASPVPYVSYVPYVASTPRKSSESGVKHIESAARLSRENALNERRLTITHSYECIGKHNDTFPLF